ncbi:MAG: YwqG family protein [Saprospiraceae bacterium]
MKDKQALIEVIKKYVVEPYRSSMIKELKPAIRLRTKGEACPKIGGTKLGGCPDLPTRINWAKNEKDGQYFSFLGQINLKETKAFDQLNLLPSKGMLYFFYNLDSGDEGSVIFSVKEEDLKKGVPPTEFTEKKKTFWQKIFNKKISPRILKESTVELEPAYDFPGWDALRLERIYQASQTDIKPIDAFDEAIFDAKYEDGESETTSNHHLLGPYQGIQHESYELNFVSIKDFQQVTLAEIDQALEWKLLLQIDSDDLLELSIGDWGRVYFFILAEDLKNLNFDNIRIQADCY